MLSLGVSSSVTRSSTQGMNSGGSSYQGDRALSGESSVAISGLQSDGRGVTSTKGIITRSCFVGQQQIARLRVGQECPSHQERERFRSGCLTVSIQIVDNTGGFVYRGGCTGWPGSGSAERGRDQRPHTRCPGEFPNAYATILPPAHGSRGDPALGPAAGFHFVTAGHSSAKSQAPCLRAKVRERSRRGKNCGGQAGDRRSGAGLVVRELLSEHAGYHRADRTTGWQARYLRDHRRHRRHVAARLHRAGLALSAAGEGGPRSSGRCWQGSSTGRPGAS